jgi:Tfp pilus assembly protein PilX
MNTPRPVHVSPAHRRPVRARRGFAAVLAMLYLVLFSTLAVGFVAAFNASAQVSHTEKHLIDARLAAESGMAFLRYHLWSLDIDHSTPPAMLFEEVYKSMSQALDDTPNLGSYSVGYDGATITLPAESEAAIPLDDDGCTFRATLTRDGKEIVARVVGQAGGASVTRGIELRYGIFERPSSIFDYGVASRSTITMIGNTAIVGSPNPAAGSVLSTATVNYPLVMGNSCSISGEVSFTNPNAWVDARAGSRINGESGEANWRDNVHIVDEPDFPVVDTSDYEKYATNLITSKNPTGTTFTNIRIKAGTNPTFSGNNTLRGVVYIETPNQVTFSGNCTITGIIVTQNNPTGDWNQNVLDFRGTVNAKGVAELPKEPQFDGLHELGGAMILADKFFVKFGGTSSAGSTAVSGSIVASKTEFYGTASATVDGSVINLDNTSVYFQGKASVTIRSTGTRNQPNGLFFGSRYEPLPGSYLEFLP